MTVFPCSFCKVALHLQQHQYVAKIFSDWVFKRSLTYASSLLHNLTPGGLVITLSLAGCCSMNLSDYHIGYAWRSHALYVTTTLRLTGPVMRWVCRRKQRTHPWFKVPAQSGESNRERSAAAAGSCRSSSASLSSPSPRQSAAAPCLPNHQSTRTS